MSLPGLNASMSYLPFAKPTLDEETIAAVVEVLRSGWIASGPKVHEFEGALSAYLGGRTVRTFTSATGALEVALQGCGVGPGDEVIVPAMTFAASANVVMRVGAKPVFVDVELASRNIDPQALEAAITPRTKAIMPVHFAGLSVDLTRVYQIAQQHGLRVIEDAAHAIGTRFQGERIGSFGDIVSFSFHPNKNMTTIEGGALSLPSNAELETIELQRFHGLRRDPDGNADVLLPGGKYNLSDVSACIGISQLKQLDGFIERRHALIARYFEQFKTDPPCLLPERGDSGHSWHLFAPLLPLDNIQLSRPQFIKAMHERGIAVGVHYPALHLFTAYRKLGYREGDFPNAERIGRETVTLPLFPTMDLSDVDRVCASVREILAGAGRAHR
jgi:dTDP-4-amino-4,6-dideoxygalactose transaminase